MEKDCKMSGKTHKAKDFFSSLSSDLPAGLVVFFVALPLCLGIALASGAPIISGLISGIIGGVVVGALSGASIGVSGPAAGLAVIVVSALNELGSFEIFLCSVFLSGFFQILLGYLRAGIIAYYFPSSVITGMLSGIGLLIILKQIPHALGLDRNPEGQLSFFQPDGLNTFTELGDAFSAISYGPFIIALMSLTLLLLWESPIIKRSPIKALPGAVLAIVFASLFGFLFQGHSSLSLTSDQFVQIPELKSFSDVGLLLRFPDFSALFTNLAVYRVALVIAVVASIETLLCVEATDKIDPRKHITPTNRELKAQGVGNILSGLIGGLPITQVIVRSSANAQAGSQTKASTIIHGVLLFLCTVFFHDLINQIPLAALASILFLVGYKLAKPSVFKKMWSQGSSQFIPFLITVVGILSTDLLTGVGAGLLAGVIAILYENFRLPFSIIKFEEKGKKCIKVLMAQQVTFLHKASLLSTLNSLPENTSIYIDAAHSTYIHPDVEEMMEDFLETAKLKNQKVTIEIHPKDNRKTKAMESLNKRESFPQKENSSFKETSNENKSVLDQPKVAGLSS